MKMDESEKKVLSIWAIITVIIVGILLFVGIKTGVININIFNKYQRENNKARFATVSNCLTKYYSFINSNDTGGIISSLIDDYLEDNQITSNNVNNYVPSFNVNTTFSTRVMYSKQISKYKNEYIITGFETESNTGKRLDTKYYQVILDSENFEFKIKPLTESEYRGEIDE